MTIRVLFQAQLRAVAQASESTCEVAAAATLFDVLTKLATEHGPDLRPHLFTASGSVRPSLLLIVNSAVISPSQAAACVLKDGDCVTLMPPIGGG